MGESRFQVKKWQDGLEIVKYRGREEEVVIPSRIDGEKVVSIGVEAFSTEWSIGLPVKGRPVVRLTIPETVHTIQPQAFANCLSLRQVKLHPGIRFIGDRAFAFCNNLEIMDFGAGESAPGIVRFPPGLRYIGIHAFVRGDWILGPRGCIFREVWVAQGTQVKNVPMPLFGHKNTFSFRGCEVRYYKEGEGRTGLKKAGGTKKEPGKPEELKKAGTPKEEPQVSLKESVEKIPEHDPLTRWVSFGTRPFCEKPQREEAKVEFVDEKNEIRRKIIDERGRIQNFPGIERGEWMKSLESETALHPVVRFRTSFERQKDGRCLVLWTVQPDGRYWEDEDGFGGTSDPEIILYTFLDGEGRFTGPFRVYKVGTKRYYRPE